MPKRNIILVVALLSVAGLLWWPAKRESPPPPQDPAPLHEAYEVIKRNFYRELSDEELREAAVKGIAARPLAEFTSETEVQDFIDQVVLLAGEQ